MDADLDKKVVVKELDLLSKVPNSPFTQGDAPGMREHTSHASMHTELLVSAGNEEMDFHHFIRYLTTVKRQQPAAWANGLLAALESVITQDNAAKSR